MHQSTKPIQKSCEIRSNICYCKVRKAITLWRAREKSDKTILHYWKDNNKFYILGAPTLFLPTVFNINKEKF